MREFQKVVDDPSPGPDHYAASLSEFEPVINFGGSKMPLTKHISFINHSQKSAFGTAERSTVFSGKNKLYDEVLTKVGNIAYTNPTPGPGKYDTNLKKQPLTTF